MFSKHGTGRSTAMVAGGRKRLSTVYPDGVEMVEEYDMMTDELIVRRWKGRTKLGKETPWEYEIGDPAEPVVCPRDTKEAWIWRVRNLTYPKDVYDVSIDKQTNEIVIRTSNKKYYKRLAVPSMVREGLPLESSALSFNYSNNTLVIEYEKPGSVLQAEEATRRERAKAKATKEGDVDCKQQ